MYAVVTGGDKGLGFHMARELKTRGYSLVLISRNGPALKNAARSIDAEYYVIDLAKNYPRAKEIIEKYRPGVLINNAGFGYYGRFVEQGEDNIRDMLRLNVETLTFLTKWAMENMRGRGGYIMNVSSLAACHPIPGSSVYAASKAYVEHFTRSLIRENPYPEVHISYLLLGPTNTDFWKTAHWEPGPLKHIMLFPEKVAKYALNLMFKGKSRIVPRAAFRLYCSLR